jgi:hypothetical protein
LKVSDIGMLEDVFEYSILNNVVLIKEMIAIAVPGVVQYFDVLVRTDHVTILGYVKKFKGPPDNEPLISRLRAMLERGI